MVTLNVMVRIETSNETDAETAYEQLKTALAVFDDIHIKGTVLKRKAELLRIGGKEQTVQTPPEVL